MVFTVSGASAVFVEIAIFTPLTVAVKLPS